MNKRKPIFFTSDWHIGHKNSLAFDNRPFRDLDHMHRVLINNYNSSIPEDGICYFLGDIGLCNKSIMRSIIDQLNGTKVLCLGNHDKGYNSMYNLGFDVVLQNASLVIAGELVTMSHYPLLDTYREDTTGMRNSGHEPWHGHDKIKGLGIGVTNEGQFHLGGHIHPRKGRKCSSKIEDKQFDIGVTANDYRPVSISEIESFITLYKQKEKKSLLNRLINFIKRDK